MVIITYIFAEIKQNQSQIIENIKKNRIHIFIGLIKRDKVTWIYMV